MRYGFVDGHCYTLKETGSSLEITSERVRQLETIVIKKLAEHTGSTEENVVDTIKTFAKNNPNANIDPDTILDTSISDLGFSTRVRVCLNRQDIQTIGELCQMTAGELLDVKTFGVSSLNEIREKLVPFNVRLRDD
jgi:DNA-directed RNA polymerase alpha subunit